MSEDASTFWPHIFGTVFKSKGMSKVWHSGSNTWQYQYWCWRRCLPLYVCLSVQLYVLPRLLLATVISTRKHRDCSSLRGGREKEGTQLAGEGTHQLGGGASMARSLLEPWEAGMRLDSVWGMTHMKIAWILFSILGRYLFTFGIKYVAWVTQW